MDRLVTFDQRDHSDKDTDTMATLNDKQQAALDTIAMTARDYSQVTCRPSSVHYRTLATLVNLGLVQELETGTIRMTQAGWDLANIDTPDHGDDDPACDQPAHGHPAYQAARELCVGDQVHLDAAHGDIARTMVVRSIKPGMADGFVIVSGEGGSYPFHGSDQVAVTRIVDTIDLDPITDAELAEVDAQLDQDLVDVLEAVGLPILSAAHTMRMMGNPLHLITRIGHHLQATDEPGICAATRDAMVMLSAAEDRVMGLEAAPVVLVADPRAALVTLARLPPSYDIAAAMSRDCAADGTVDGPDDDDLGIFRCIEGCGNEVDAGQVVCDDCLKVQAAQARDEQMEGGR